jgi:UDP:flavonoid glycosyltransferase YjiC (YdhE family)
VQSSRRNRPQPISSLKRAYFHIAEMPSLTAAVPDIRPPGRPRVLFVAEAVTLAHPARAFALAQGIERRGFTPILAADPRFAGLFPPSNWQAEKIHSISTESFLTALAHGSRIYDLPTLRAYVEEDLALMRKTRPSVVVGDFRLTLAISARVLSIPYINVTNAYWSPYARQDWCVPALPWVKYAGVAAANRIFRSIRKMSFAAHARPMEKLRGEYGLPSRGDDLLRQYSDGDICLYADMPELVPIFDAPQTHRYLGPVAWSAPVPLPAWWSELKRDGKLIYVTLGSSGDRSRLPNIVEALAGLGPTVVVAAAGAAFAGPPRSNVRVAPYLPGDLVVERSALVVCNGGSLTSYQGLMKGVPVLALPSNLDQFLNSGYLKASNVGDWLRPEDATIPALREKATAMLGDSHMRLAAQAIASSIRRSDPAARLASAIDELGAGAGARTAQTVADSRLFSSARNPRPPGIERAEDA